MSEMRKLIGLKIEIESRKIKKHEGKNICSEVELRECHTNLRKKYIRAFVKTLNEECMVPTQDLSWE